MENNNYYVIGGQYRHHCYGGTETLEQASKLARKCEEYWDNWQGFHFPNIYRAEDTVEIETENGFVRVPKENATAVEMHYPMRTLKGLSKAVKEYNRYLYNNDWNATLMLDVKTGKVWTDIEYGNSWNSYDTPEIVNIMSLVGNGGEASEDAIKEYCRKHFNIKGWGEKE